MSATASTPPPLRIAAFAGSLRRASFNRGLLAACLEAAPPDLAITVFDLAPLPFYNGDVEAEGDPGPVADLKAAVRAADGVLIVTPEYNRSVPAVTKNAVDWLSRPPAPNALAAKPVAIAGATPGMLGTARGQADLRHALAGAGALCMPGPELYVAHAESKFDTSSGRLTDDSTRAFLAKFLGAFAVWARNLRRAP